jgi:hypothetical protein
MAALPQPGDQLAVLRGIRRADRCALRRRSVGPGEGIGPCVGAQETQYREAPQDRKEHYQKQSQEPRRRAHPTNNQGRKCSDYKHRAERSIH